MKYFKKPDGTVWAYESDGSQDYLITADMTPCVKPVAAGLSFADQRAAELASYIDTREKMCARVAGIGQRLGRAGDHESALSCDAVVDGLLDVLAHESVTEATDIDALKQALKTQYLAAVERASEAAKIEFKRYDK